MKNEKTSWEGLWRQREGVYCGYTLKKADIPNYAKLIVRFNRNYKADKNRPKFVYCFASGDAAKAITIEKTHDEYVSFEEMEERIRELEEQVDSMYTYDEVTRAVRQAAIDGANGYTDVIASDYL